jgi:hypothetical protein
MTKKHHKYVQQPQKLCKFCGKMKTAAHRINYVDGKPVCYEQKLKARNRRHGFLKKRPPPISALAFRFTGEKKKTGGKGVVGAIQHLTRGVTVKEVPNGEEGG